MRLYQRIQLSNPDWSRCGFALRNNDTAFQLTELFGGAAFTGRRIFCAVFESGFRWQSHLSAFGKGGQNLPYIGMTDGPLFGGAAFHWNCCCRINDLLFLGHLVVVLW